MKKIETVLDLLVFIDSEKKAGRIDFETPVFCGIIAGMATATYMGDAEAEVCNMSSHEFGRKVNRGGKKVLLIK